jgi:hypothetical protein
MPKSGHELRSLGPQFPAQVCRKLLEGFSITTAEEFLGWAITQNLESVAQSLNVSQRLLEKAMNTAKGAADPRFLRELHSAQEQFPTGAEINDHFVLPPDLAQHLQEG